MTKLTYPKNGILNIISTELSDCKNNLNNASSNTDYSVPSDFSYYSFMDNLKTTLSEYSKEMSTIIRKITETNKVFEELELEMTSESKTISDYKCIITN